MMCVLRNVVLCQPALSPDYDLGPTLSKVAGKVVCFCSPFDAFTLGLGTIVFGTMESPTRRLRRQGRIHHHSGHRGSAVEGNVRAEKLATGNDPHRPRWRSPWEYSAPVGTASTLLPTCARAKPPIDASAKESCVAKRKNAIELEQ